MAQVKIDLHTEEWEDFVAQPLKIIRWTFLVYSLVTFLVPIYKESSFGIDSFVSFICWVIMFGCCLSCHGLLFDFLSLFPVITIRAIFIIYNIFMNKGAVNYYLLAVIMIVEFVLNVLYLSDKDSYTYIVEEEDKDEFY